MTTFARRGGGGKTLTVDATNPTGAWQRLQPHLTADKVPASTGDTACAPGFTRFVCISDTHGRHAGIEHIPPGDVLIHAGDFTDTGSVEQVREFATWFGAQPHRHKVVIAGNHDTTLHEVYYAANWNRYHYKARLDDAEARRIMASDPNFTYLEDSGACVLGYQVYGSPWQPEFCDWAFNLDRGDPCRAVWKQIPTEAEVLVTHGPPVGHGDLCQSRLRAGCVDLLAEVTQRIKPLAHVFGHIHEGYGVTTDGTTQFINASTCNFSYRPNNPPIVFDLPARTGHVSATGPSATAVGLGLGGLSVTSSSRSTASRSPSSRTPR